MKMKENNDISNRTGCLAVSTTIHNDSDQ